MLFYPNSLQPAGVSVFLIYISSASVRKHLPGIKQEFHIIHYLHLWEQILQISGLLLKKPTVSCQDTSNVTYRRKPNSIEIKMGTKKSKLFILVELCRATHVNALNIRCSCRQNGVQVACECNVAVTVSVYFLISCNFHW